MTAHLKVLSLCYSSWSIRAWLALRIAGIEFDWETIPLEDVGRPLDVGEAGLVAAAADRLAQRRAQGSVNGFFPVLHLGDVRIHESLAICEWAAEQNPDAGLWPEDSLLRARARAASSEMSSSFSNLRAKMGCQVFARVPDFRPDAATQVEIQRVFEIWREALDASGGPFLFGGIGIADCMYFPVLTRFRTYGVALGTDLEGYARVLEDHPAVVAWSEEAQRAPAIPDYDAGIRALGGDPTATRPSA